MAYEGLDVPGSRPAGLRSGLVEAGLHHRYNTTLKRVCVNKSRAKMTLAELVASASWLERNRPS